MSDNSAEPEQNQPPRPKPRTRKSDGPASNVDSPPQTNQSTEIDRQASSEAPHDSPSDESSPDSSPVSPHSESEIVPPTTPASNAPVSDNSSTAGSGTLRLTMLDKDGLIVHKDVPINLPQRPCVVASSPPSTHSSDLPSQPDAPPNACSSPGDSEKSWVEIVNATGPPLGPDPRFAKPSATQSSASPSASQVPSSASSATKKPLPQRANPARRCPVAISTSNIPALVRKPTQPSRIPSSKRTDDLSQSQDTPPSASTAESHSIDTSGETRKRKGPAVQSEVRSKSLTM